MAKVHILNVTVHNNPAPFFTPFQFEIHFECLEELQDDLEFKIIYVGSAETIEFDQTLDQIVVDAVPKGQFKFMFQADPPNTSKIPADDAVGVTVVLITASYRDQEFVRVGYYVNNEYEDPELREEPPAEPQFSKLIRQIATDQPRVTKFKINWDSATAPVANPQEETNSATATATQVTTVGTGGAASATSDTIVTYFNEQDVEMSTDDTTSSNKNEIVSQSTSQTVEI
jgi:histone chaperone ASF1